MLSGLILLLSAISVWSSYIPTDRIVGGYPITIDQRPFQASIVLYGDHFCGGSIIKKNVILTAAHCLKGLSTNYLQVRVGSTERARGGTLIDVRKIVYHEHYDDAVEGLDIGLIWLAQALEFHDKVQMVALPEQDETFADGLTAVVSGWGRLDFEGELADVLQEVQIPVVNHGLCTEEYRGYINGDMICAGNDEGGKDACQLDSGGPLTVGTKQAGIVSFGFKCAQPHYPGVYTNVAHFRDWIEYKILEDKVSSRL